MPRRKQFTEVEVCEIWRLKANGKTVAEIAEELNRSQRGIYAILQKGHDYHAKPRSGRPRCTSARDDRRVVRMAADQHLSISGIQCHSGLRISRSTIHRRLRNSGRVVFYRMARMPQLSPTHMSSRMEWARQHMSWTDKWLTTIFSDEKKWNLDGPDGWASYWHDLRKQPRCFFSRQQGAGSVMVWGGFSFNGTTALAFLAGRQKAENYQNTLQNYLLPTAVDLAGPNFVFQQDNASIHVAKSTKRWLEQHNITTMDWPAKSPDLNPIENLWGMLSRSVYADCRQFSTVNDLRHAIEDSWYNLDPEMLQSLILSMPTRVFNVIKVHGRFTSS